VARGFAFTICALECSLRPDLQSIVVRRQLCETDGELTLARQRLVSSYFHQLRQIKKHASRIPLLSQAVCLISF